MVVVFFSDKMAFKYAYVVLLFSVMILSAQGRKALKGKHKAHGLSLYITL